MISLVVVWLHILAAIAWIGGMIFLSLVLVPVLKGDGQFGQWIGLFRAIALRFRILVWSSVTVLLGTGLLLVGQLNIVLHDLASWPRILIVKLSLVVILLLMTLLHDWVVGPRVVRIMTVPAELRTPIDQALVLSSSWLPRLSLLLAICLLYAAASLARS